MRKTKRFRKVVKWDTFKWSNNNPTFRDNHFLFISFLFMIPIVGQILWILCLYFALGYRQVYYKEVK
ncbi:hypothetical protein LCGC14_2479980 [marine sediment metagenome]|uniref:Uncharacterized protein n=1 Tax=marine sediment metagenome TaxID=412755 RepID=A0A0F9B7V6_9ZZZZ